MHRVLSPSEVSLVRPHNIGWLRRPELDCEDMAVWEKPDGSLYVQHANRGEPIIALLKIPLRKITSNASETTTDKA